MSVAAMLFDKSIATTTVAERCGNLIVAIGRAQATVRTASDVGRKATGCYCRRGPSTSCGQVQWRSDPSRRARLRGARAAAHSPQARMEGGRDRGALPAREKSSAWSSTRLGHAQERPQEIVLGRDDMKTNPRSRDRVTNTLVLLFGRFVEPTAELGITRIDEKLLT